MRDEQGRESASNSDPVGNAAPADSPAQRTNRRELMKKIGKFSAYTAPAIAVLFASQRNAFGY